MNLSIDAPQESWYEEGDTMEQTCAWACCGVPCDGGRPRMQAQNKPFLDRSCPPRLMNMTSTDVYRIPKICMIRLVEHFITADT